MGSVSLIQLFAWVVYFACLRADIIPLNLILGLRIYISINEVKLDYRKISGS